MSFDRPQHGPQIGLGGAITPGIKGLLIGNIGVYLLQILAYRLKGAHLETYFGLRWESVHENLAVWQFFTYMFLHDPNWLTHLLLNMLMLWMFGTEVERLWGTRAFLKYYALCGVGGGLLTCLVFPESLTIGASGAIFGVMLAYGFIFPRRYIYFWFIFPMRALSFVMLCIGIQLFSLLSLTDGVAYSAHLGGMLFGYLYLKRAWRLREFLSEVRWRLRRRRFRVMRGDDEHYPFH